MKKLVYLALFVVSLLVVLWFFVPLERLLPFFAQRLQPVQIEGVAGSLYRGSARELRLAGFVLGKLQWNKQWPTAPPGLQGQYRLKSTDYDLVAHLRLSRAGGLHASDLRGEIGWKYLENFLHLPPGRMTGRLRLDIGELAYGPAGMERINGRISLDGLRIVSPIALPLGDLWADIQTERSGLAVGHIRSNSRVLDASGVIYLHPHRFEVNLVLKPKPGEYEAQLALQSIGQPLAGGGRRIQVAGFY